MLNHPPHYRINRIVGIANRTRNHWKQAQMSADKSTTYSSTRGCPTQANLSFRDVVMRGLSHDRGLFVPDALPTVTKEEVESWRSLPYHELATNVIGKFVQDDQVPRAKLAEIVEKSCAAFRSEDVTPVIDVGGHMVLVRFACVLTLLSLSFVCVVAGLQ